MDATWYALNNLRHVDELFLLIAQGPYFFWVLELLRTYKNHTLILVEYNHISLRLHSSKFLIDEAAQDVHDIIVTAGFAKACVVGHSFGTFVASRLCKLHPEVSLPLGTLIR